VRGQVQHTTETVIDGWPLRVPVIDIHSIGAGGGSIAWLDAGGALRVGPQSTGADPGPACYGKGDLPTVTDAHLLLGRLGPEPHLGGALALDADRAHRVVEALAREAGLHTMACAEGIIAVANTAMERALRVISVERGHDPRDFCLVGFGGAGPLHAAELAAALRVSTVLIPAAPGVLSAFGMLMADVVKDYSRTVMRTLAPGESERATFGDIEAAFAELKGQALEDMSDEGFADGEVQVERSLDMRYRGQAFELTVPFAADSVQRFHNAHQTAYGYGRPGEPVAIVNVRLKAVAPVPAPRAKPAATDSAPEAPSPTGSVPLSYAGEQIEAATYDRAQLAAAHRVLGPAVIGEDTATTFVPPAFSATVAAWGNLLLTGGET
jgi:N-methylhydantoinase A